MKAQIPRYRKNIIRILSLFFVLFPWITHFEILLYSDMQSQVLANVDGMATDVYFYYKQVALIIMAAFTVLFFLGERIFPDKKDNNVSLLKGNNKVLFILSALFLLSALISAIFAQDAKTAWWGLPTEGEGFFTLLSYIAIMLMFYNYFGNEYGLKLFKKCVLILSGITVVLGTIEYFYKPLMMTSAVKWLVGMGDYIESIAGNEVDIFSDSVALSFGNPNYFGGFVCLLFPFVLAAFYEATEKKSTIISGVLSLGLSFCVMASKATTSLYVAIFEFVLVSLIYGIKKRDRVVYIKTGILIIAITVLMIIFGGRVAEVFSNENSATGKIVESVFEIEDITLADNSVKLEGRDAELTITYSAGEISFKDAEGERLDARVNENVFSFENEEFKDLSVKLLVTESGTEDILAKLVVDAGYDDSIDFYILENGKISGVGQNNSIVMDIEDAGIPESLKKYYGIFTGRGYAWVNSWPVLKESVLIGQGPGHFVYEFKQNDYVGMLQTHRSTKYVIDKPHSMYLQYAINIGLIGMVAFVGIFVLALVRGGKALKQPKGVRAEIVAGVVAIGGFLIYSAVNDSVVSVMPLVMAVVGVMLAADRK